ncbi:MAG: hypothetical protein LBT78_01890, partial [Tannerella sp.]|nr:hypothetical protein [Tannerella sp.]
PQNRPHLGDRFSVRLFDQVGIAVTRLLVEIQFVHLRFYPERSFISVRKCFLNAFHDFKQGENRPVLYLFRHSYNNPISVAGQNYEIKSAFQAEIRLKLLFVCDKDASNSAFTCGGKLFPYGENLFSPRKNAFSCLKQNEGSVFVKLNGNYGFIDKTPYLCFDKNQLT